MSPHIFWVCAAMTEWSVYSWELQYMVVTSLLLRNPSVFVLWLKTNPPHFIIITTGTLFPHPCSSRRDVCVFTHSSHG